MATNLYIRGLSRQGFRVPKVGAINGWVKQGVNTQVNVDDDKTQLILAGQRQNAGFIRVAGVGNTTATIIGLGRRGFRIKNQGGSRVIIKVGSGVTTVDLTDPSVMRNLFRNKRDWVFAASATALSVRGLQEQQNGFDLRGNGSSVLTSTNVNVSNADTVVIGAQTYTFKTNLTERQATAVLTEGATPFADADTVTINNVTYRIKTIMAQANDVQRGGTGDLTLGALIKAVNGTGLVGTDYFAGTVKPTSVTAGALSGSGATATVTFTAAVGTGTAGNAFPSTTTGAHSTFSGVTFGTGAATVAGVNAVANEVKIGGSADASLTDLAEAINTGANPGVDYASNTVKNVDVTAGAEDAVNHKLTLTAIQGGNISVALSTTAVTLSFSVATITDAIVKVYNGVSATVDATNPFNYQQLRRFYKSWIEA